MIETLLMGRGQTLKRIPYKNWKAYIEKAPERGQRFLSFMTETHHAVRNFAVRELPRRGKPLAVVTIAEELKLSRQQVDSILDELEEKLVFLVRNEQGAIAWAFPITIEKTPYHLTFSSGEQLYAA